MDSMREKCRELTNSLSEVDFVFLGLRLITVLGGVALLALMPFSAGQVPILLKALTYFSLYSLCCYLIIFLRPGWLREVYLISLFLDLSFLSYLIYSHPDPGNSFFIGYYLLVCLHTIYFGLQFGLVVATLAVLFYLACILGNIEAFTVTELVLRTAFLFLLAIPVGFLSEKVKRDKLTVEQLNSELAASLENLRSTQEKLIEAEKFSALGRLTTYIAHEIRNPLTALGGFARRLEKKLAAGTPEQEYASVIVHEVARLEKILLDTLVYGREDAVKLARTDLHGPATAAVSLYRDICREQNITIREHYAQNLPRIKIDASQIQQALDSLFTNSIQAMPQGGEITILTGNENRHNTIYQTITVTDTGKGIDQETIDYIFEPFYSTKKIGTGTGLGLPIVKKIIDEHRGMVKVDRPPAGGTSFTLYFPYQSEEQDQMTPCWEYLRCGIERDSARRCGAFPYFGRNCWSTAGSFSESGNRGICAQKIENCRDCSFFKIGNAHFPLYTDTAQQTIH